MDRAKDTDSKRGGLPAKPVITSASQPASKPVSLSYYKETGFLYSLPQKGQSYWLVACGLPPQKPDRSALQALRQFAGIDSAAVNPTEAGHQSREPVATPKWYLRTSTDCRKIAERIVQKVEKFASENKIKWSEVVGYLLGMEQAEASPTIKEPSEMAEIRSLLKPIFERDPDAMKRLLPSELLPEELGKINLGDQRARIDHFSSSYADALRVLFAEQSIWEGRDKLAEPFVKAVRDEMARQKILLDALENISHREYAPAPDEHFKDMAIGRKSVLRNWPLISADLWNGRSAPSGGEDSPLLGLNTPTNRKIEGFTFKFGFFETQAPLTEGQADNKNPYKVVYPIISLDEEVLDAVTGIIDDATPHSELALRILKGVRDFSALGGHDTWHHLFYGIKNNPGNRFSFTDSTAPFQKTNSNPDDKEAFDLSDYDMGREASFKALENHAYLSHRATWRQVFASKPNIANGLIRRFGNFLADLAELKSELTARVGEEKATSMVKYFAIVAYDQVSLLMSHEEIGSNQTANRNGDNLDQAILRLGLPAYQLKSSRVLRVVQDILLGPEIVWAILQTALSKGPSNALSVSIMEYVAKATGITVMDLQQGKESVYSIEDKLPDPFILIRDVARSDDQSFGLDALLTIDPSPEGDPYRPYIWPVNLNKFFYQQIVSAIKESKDYQLSGLRGLVAEQYYFNDRRLIWLDAYDGKLNPIAKLHKLQRAIGDWKDLHTDEWRQQRAEFDIALIQDTTLSKA